MRTPYDYFGKRLSRAALQGYGLVETEVEVTSEPRRIDLRFTPGAASEPRPPHLGLFGRMTRDASTVEFFHRTPSGDELAACLVKHGNFRHGLWSHDDTAPVPILWVISAGRPDGAIDGLWFRPMAGWPPGFYEGPPLLWIRLVVVNELPVTRDTLLLRLLGAGRVLRRASDELKAMSVEAPDRKLALPFLLELRVDMARDPNSLTEEDKEFLMETQDIVEMWRREADEQGLARGLEQGREQGREQGLRYALIAVYRARFGEIPEDVRAAMEDTHDSSILDAWVTRIGSVESAAEIDADVRAVRSRGEPRAAAQ